jgi:hypothetical protein
MIKKNDFAINDFANKKEKQMVMKTVFVTVTYRKGSPNGNN